jgi:hypothetical protein
VGGGGGADRADRFCEVEAGDASFVAEAFDHLLELDFVGGGVEGFVDYLVADCFVEGVGFFGVEGFGGLRHEGGGAIVCRCRCRGALSAPSFRVVGDDRRIYWFDVVGGDGRGKRARTSGGWWVREGLVLELGAEGCEGCFDFLEFGFDLGHEGGFGEFGFFGGFGALFDEPIAVLL